jgi:hypothetical protein
MEQGRLSVDGTEPRRAPAVKLISLVLWARRKGKRDLSRIDGVRGKPLNHEGEQTCE